MNGFIFDNLIFKEFAIFQSSCWKVEFQISFHLFYSVYPDVVIYQKKQKGVPIMIEIN